MERDTIDIMKSPIRMEWWLHVTDTPLLRRMIVFSNGILRGLKGEMRDGGHTPPISTTGPILL